eukprot:2826702-Pyramimonas_sp.AAC.1
MGVCVCVCVAGLQSEFKKAKNAEMLKKQLKKVVSTPPAEASQRPPTLACMLDGYSAPQSYIPIERLRLAGGCGIFLLRGYDWPMDVVYSY